MKTIIRIEHTCGNGLWRSMLNEDTPIWRSFSFSRDLSIKHSDFPTPFEEKLHLKTDEYCAFKSIEQIQQWIEPEWFKEIIELGFKIWMIDVSDWKEGNYQILFKKENILSKKNITQLFVNK